MILLNEYLFPKGITKDDLEYFELGIKEHLNFFHYAFPEIDVTVELSSSMPKKKYGDYSLSIAKKKILKELGDIIIIDDDSELIKNLRKSKNKNQIKDIIEEIFKRYFDPFCQDILIQKKRGILNILDRVYFQRNVLGEYVYKTHWVSYREKTIDESKIVLYVNNIAMSLETGEKFEDRLKEVVAHEYFHMFHHYAGYVMNNYEFDERKDYLSDVVRESLATFFQKWLCNLIPQDPINNILVDPYVGWTYLRKYINWSSSDLDDSFFRKSLYPGMNKWLKDVLDDNQLYYQILNKGIHHDESISNKANNGIKLKIGSIFKAKDQIDLFENRFRLELHTSNNKRLFDLENGQQVLFVPEFILDVNDLDAFNLESILSSDEMRHCYSKTIHIFSSNQEGEMSYFKYLGSFRLKSNEYRKQVLVREEGEELIRPLSSFLKENLLATLRNPKNQYFSFMIDKYKFPEIDIDDNFYDSLNEILYKKGITYYKMYKLCDLNKDNCKGYFNKKKYLRKSNDSPYACSPFVVPAKIAYKICLGLRLNLDDAKHLMSLAKKPREDISDFVLACLQDEELLSLEDSEYKKEINAHLIAGDRDILFKMEDD